MSTASRGGEITLTGSPGNLAVVIPIDALGETLVPVSVTVGGESTIYRATVLPFGRGRSRIRLRLPVDTPPGSYGGEATIGGKPRRIVVDVESVLRIRVQPRQTVLQAVPSSSVEFTLTLLNSGNVSFDVPKAEVVEFDDAAGQERALGRTLRASLGQGEHHVDRFFEELREGHGGEARVVVKSGGGRLAPGESREVTCVLDVPAALQPGRSYLGSWLLGNSAHVIVVEVAMTARPRNGRAKP